MQEFVYYNKKSLDFPLNDDIYIANETSIGEETDFIISNSDKVNAEVVATEIDFYINNTKDTMANKISNIAKIYELNAIRFDMAQDVSYSYDVSNQVLVIANEIDKDSIVKQITVDEFDIFYIQEETLINITGNIGDLQVTVKSDEKEITLKVSQIIWFDEKELGMKQSGCFDPNKSSVKKVLKEIRENISHFTYKKFTTYDATICQYHERREEICARCEEVCPTVAIVKIDEKKHLEFNQIDCHGCGGCISVCPSGALDYAPSNRETISEMAPLMSGHIPLIIPQKMKLKKLSVELKENVLPFAIEGEKFLHEATFLTLLQESGSQIIFYSDFISKGTGDAIEILNKIYQKKYFQDAIIIAKDDEELKKALKEVQFIEGSKYSYNHPDLRKREMFAIRLNHIVGDEDLGEVECGEFIHYGVVKVNEDKCTLCLSCVGACNVDAITANAKDNTLRFNPSLCTTCGYCEVSCPEKDCISIELDVIKLNPTWFQSSILAQDELFPCVECGKEFATKKAIEKIAGIMKPLFKSDPIKERTLYCCEDCKPKIMMTSYMQNKDQYNNTTIK